MKTIKISFILFIFFFFYQANSSSLLDSLKVGKVKYLISNLNEDCYKDTLYGNIIHSAKILPTLIIWGKRDTNIICDTSRFYLYDSLNLEFTTIEYDSNNSSIINLSTIDVSGDYIKDLNYSYENIDSNGVTSIKSMLIFGNNSLSKNANIFIASDSLLNDSLNSIIPDYSNSTVLLRSYGTHRIYLIDDNVQFPQPLIQTNLANNVNIGNEFLVFPNPNKGELNFKVKKPPFKIEIINMSGKIIFSSNEINSSEYRKDISSYTNGLYYIRIFDKNNSRLFKIIKSN